MKSLQEIQGVSVSLTFTLTSINNVATKQDNSYFLFPDFEQQGTVNAVISVQLTVAAPSCSIIIGNISKLIRCQNL